MEGFWKIRDSKSNQLIAIKDSTIYMGNPSKEELHRLNTIDGITPLLNDLFSLPYSYIRGIENQSGKNVIKIFYGTDSEEELVIKDPKLKKEIFELLRNDMTNFHYRAELPSTFKYIKTQLFAAFFLTIIFVWSMYYAIQLENGVQFELVEGGRPGIEGLIFGLGSLGSLKVSSVFIVIMAIIVMSIRKKLKTRSEIEYLTR